MIEIFKTNVNDPRYADILVEHIERTFRGYEVNFDLQDCDKILRVKCSFGVVDVNCLINMLGNFGFHAEVLEDGLPTLGGLFLIDLKHQSILN